MTGLHRSCIPEGRHRRCMPGSLRRCHSMPCPNTLIPLSDGQVLTYVALVRTRNDISYSSMIPENPVVMLIVRLHVNITASKPSPGLKTNN